MSKRKQQTRRHQIRQRYLRRLKRKKVLAKQQKQKSVAEVSTSVVQQPAG
ncbi:MAG: hypothetical protein AB1349_02555 [Elusimicrobiota bacterium]